ncbi:MAG: hypothetical protein P1V35_15130, partial [Planctomycetota bacterium]|nr:hypothetical protein [Planctomycetota bacterium]
KEPMPQEGTRALLVLDGPALAEPLRLPCTIQRNFHHAKAPRMGLKFLGDDSPDWLRTEYQLQDYLMQRQRDHLRFRAA